MGDIYSGRLIPAKELMKLPVEERKNFVEVIRDLTLKEAADMKIHLYSPCMCGSGKKFKFCCYKVKP